MNQALEFCFIPLPVQSLVLFSDGKQRLRRGLRNLSQVTWLVSSQDSYPDRSQRATGRKYAYFRLRSHTTVLSLPGTMALSIMCLVEKEHISFIQKYLLQCLVMC